MEVRAGYKRTEVGVIPNDWRVKAAAEICELVVDCKNRTPPVVPGGAYGVVRTPNVRDGKFVWEELRFTDEHSYREWTARATPQLGDVLITREAPLGEVCLVPPGTPVCLGQRMMLYRPDQTQADSSYLLYSLMSLGVRGSLLKKIGGSTVGHAKVDDIRNLQVPLPPSVDEQRAIATALSDVDALLAKIDQLIAKKRDLKEAAMQQLLTGQTRLPGFSGAWEVKRLGDIAEIIMGQSPSSSNYNRSGAGLPLIQGNADISNRKTIKRIFTTVITKRGKSGDVLMSVRAPVGEISRATFDVCLGRGVCAIRYPNDFAYHLLISLEPTWARLSKGSTFDSVNSSDVRALEVNMPNDLIEQTAIATILSDMDAELAALEARRDKTRALKQGMMQALLTGRIRLV